MILHFDTYKICLRPLFRLFQTSNISGRSKHPKIYFFPWFHVSTFSQTTEVYSNNSKNTKLISVNFNICSAIFDLSRCIICFSVGSFGKNLHFFGSFFNAIYKNARVGDCFENLQNYIKRHLFTLFLTSKILGTSKEPKIYIFPVSICNVSTFSQNPFESGSSFTTFLLSPR